MTKTGKWVFTTLFSLSLFISLSASAALQASVDRTEVPLDESISFKITISGDSGSVNPKFEAPDFEIMNQFQNSQYSSVYINGKMESKSENSTTYILRPLKVGALKIHNISNNNEKAQDITIQVVQENLYKKSVQGEAPSLKGDAKNFFVKADLNKTKIYKGEQIIVSYYLYRRTRASVRDVMQYPSFQGFIREDLEMPILSGHPDFEAVNLGGVPFERALLARYAIYPIKEGKLALDGFSVRVDYIPKNSASDDQLEDPFFQFFTQVTPRTGTSKSDPITLNVLPLPEEGKSNLFTGGVGDFEVSATLDSAQIKANTPITLHVSVKGKGNTSLIEFPPVSWPKELKFYESQGKTKSLGQGASEKTFEVVLVPKEKGSYQIPPIEFEFFSPESRAYVRAKTQNIPIEVAEGDPGSASSLPEKPLAEDSAQANLSASPAESYGTLRTKDRPQESSSSFLGQPWWRWVAWFGLIVFFSFVGLVIFDQAKKRSLAQLEVLKKRQSSESFWKNLRKDAEGLQSSHSSSQSFSPVLEKTVDEVYKTLDSVFGIASRATPSRDLAKILIETHSVSETQWKQIAELLEFTEMVRFSSASYSADPGQAEKVLELIENAKKLCSDFSSKKLENKA